MPLVTALLGASGSFAFAADNGTVSVGAGVNYSSGTYGTSATTNILSIPFSVRYDSERWTLKATIPWLRITGGTRVIPGIGPVANTNPRGRGATTATESTASGLGDLVTGVTYNAYYDQAPKFGLDVTGKVKWGTADVDKGLGTGENDYSAQMDAYKTIDRMTWFGGIGYTNLGSSRFIQLRNVWNLNLGGSYKLDERDSAGLTFDGRERVSSTAFPQRELTAFWARKLDRNWKMQAYALKGFANGSPDWGAGTSVAYAF
jgi:hypothetical protein